MIRDFLKKVSGVFNVITLYELTFSLICFIMGLILFSFPSIGNTFISISIGLLFVINGVISIYSFIKRGAIALYNNNLIYGLLLMIIGLLIIFMNNILAILLGIYLIIVGIQRMNVGFVLNKFGESSWLITCGVGLLFIVIGIVTMISKGDLIAKIAGIYLLGYSLINIVNIIILRNRGSHFIA